MLRRFTPLRAPLNAAPLSLTAAPGFATITDLTRKSPKQPHSNSKPQQKQQHPKQPQQQKQSTTDSNSAAAAARLPRRPRTPSAPTDVSLPVNPPQARETTAATAAATTPTAATTSVTAAAAAAVIVPLQPHYAHVVIGGGVVGLAVARALAPHGPTLVLERAPTVASGTSARNSGVVHSGVYYPIDSLKTELCLRGRELLYEYAAKKGIPHAYVLSIFYNKASIVEVYLYFDENSSPGIVT